MAGLREDLRFASRLLRKNPAFTAVAILTLALAIGANTTIFSVVNGVLLRPLPFPEPERLFQVVRRNPEGQLTPLSAPQYAFLLEQRQPFASLLAYPELGTGFNLSGDGLPEHIAGARVTRTFFEVMGSPPTLGRGFLPEEDAPGGPKVVVVGQGLWRQRFGARKELLGQTLTLNGEPHTVIGIAPPGFQYPQGAQLWTPLQLELTSTDNTHYLTVIGRLRPGVDAAQVSTRVREQGEQLRAGRPAAMRERHGLEALELHSLRKRSLRPALLVLLGAVGLVLLIACVNVANLQLARAAERQPELAMRIALGASPGRLARQLLTESLLLAGLGGALGLLLADSGLTVLLVLSPQLQLFQESVSVDGVVLAFTLGVSVLTGLVFGSVSAWGAARLERQGVLRASTPRATSGRSELFMRRGLVVSQVALAVILLIGAALLARSFIRLRDVPLGFEPRNVLTMKLSLPEASYGHPEALEAFAQRVKERVNALPGVQTVGLTLTVPLETGSQMDFVIHRRQPGASGTEAGEALYRPVTRGYFEALKIERVRGRLLDDLDHHGSALVAVINEAAARRFWPGEDPIGQLITLGRSIPEMSDPVPREIVGVVRDVHEVSLQEEAPAIIYVPLGQVAPAFAAMYVRLAQQSLLVRSSGEALPLAAQVQRELWAVDPRQPVTEVASMEEHVSRSLGSQRFNLLMMGLMAGLALVLAAVGLYGVLAYTVNQQTRELAIRMALGAMPAQVVWRVLRQGLGLVGMGVALGVAGAWGLTRLLTHLLYAVSPLDAAAFIAALGVLLGVALVATWLPAMRASRLEPMVVLRSG